MPSLTCVWIHVAQRSPVVRKHTVRRRAVMRLHVGAIAPVIPPDVNISARNGVH